MGVRTTIQSPTQETPFRMTYGCEAMIPSKLVTILEKARNPGGRRTESNSRALATEMEPVDEVEPRPLPRHSDQAITAAKHNRKVKPVAFDQGRPGPKKGRHRKSVKRTWNGDKLRAYYS
ncbi:hypothetical protein K1719_040494 [Acacia pycnantha]|nr:hypothetical protein K1719_040494 [Acacia pycnantha]